MSAQTARVAFGALLLLTGFGLAGPVLVRPLTAPARALLSLASGFCGNWAGRQMIRNPRRVAGAAGTLGVAVATIAIVATPAATFTSSAAQNVRRSLLASYPRPPSMTRRATAGRKCACWRAGGLPRGCVGKRRFGGSGLCKISQAASAETR